MGYPKTNHFHVLEHLKSSKLIKNSSRNHSNNGCKLGETVIAIARRIASIIICLTIILTKLLLANLSLRVD